MQKLVVGIGVVLCLHIGFTAYVSTPDTAESARLRRSATDPVLVPPPGRPVADEDIIIARGADVETPVLVPAAADRTVTRPAPVQRRSSDREPGIIKTAKPLPARTVPVYQTARYIVERTEFPENLSFAAAGDRKRADLSAETKTIGPKHKRSFLSKVGSIIKKPYDGLKAVASWLR